VVKDFSYLYLHLTWVVFEFLGGVFSSHSVLLNFN
jgi:hypothetical protein